jgi:hypothetical protein
MESFQFLLQMLKDQEKMDQHFITQEVDGVEDKGSGNTIGIMTLVDAFLNTFIYLLYFTFHGSYGVNPI